MWDRMPMEHKVGLKPWMLHTPQAAVRDGVDEECVVQEAESIGGRPGTPEEIAGIVRMLCMQDSVWCTGQVICANGGMRFGV